MELKELILVLFTNIVTSTFIMGLFVFVFKKWFEKTIDIRYKALEESIKLKADIDKNQALDFLHKQRSIYPEIIEIIYRLKNILREIRDYILDNSSFFRDGLLTEIVQKKEQSKSYSNNTTQFYHLVYVLTENLYKYRAFLDSDTFDQLHDYKRKVQDVSVIIDCLTRSPEPTKEENDKNRDAWSINSHRLNNIFDDITILQDNITKHIKKQLEKHIPVP